MRTVYKYRFQLTDKTEIKIPLGAKFVHTGLDAQGTPCCWFEVNTDEPFVNITFDIFVVGTGNPMPKEAKKHLGSFLDRSFVWHIYTS